MPGARGEQGRGKRSGPATWRRSSNAGAVGRGSSRTRAQSLCTIHTTQLTTPIQPRTVGGEKHNTLRPCVLLVLGACSCPASRCRVTGQVWSSLEAKKTFQEHSTREAKGCKRRQSQTTAQRHVQAYSGIEQRIVPLTSRQWKRECRA